MDPFSVGMLIFIGGICVCVVVGGIMSFFRRKRRIQMFKDANIKY